MKRTLDKTAARQAARHAAYAAGMRAGMDPPDPYTVPEQYRDYAEDWYNGYNGVSVSLRNQFPTAHDRKTETLLPL